jgi:hypothetical protein
VRAVFAITLLLWPTALHAAAEKRIALLIGNKDYKAGVGALTNPQRHSHCRRGAQGRRVRGAKAYRECTAIRDADRHPRVRGPLGLTPLGSFTTQVTASHRPAKII